MIQFERNPVGSGELSEDEYFLDKFVLVVVNGLVFFGDQHVVGAELGLADGAVAGCDREPSLFFGEVVGDLLG